MRKTTLGLELMALNGEEMTLGRKLEKRLWVMSVGICELSALNGKEMTVGHKCEKQVWVVSSRLQMEKK